MTNRFQTTLAEETGTSFSPTGDFLVQVDSAIAVTVDIEARVDGSAAWVGIGSIRSDSQPVTNFTKMPFVRYHVRGNTAGNTVTVWDNG